MKIWLMQALLVAIATILSHNAATACGGNYFVHLDEPIMKKHTQLNEVGFAPRLLRTYYSSFYNTTSMH